MKLDAALFGIAAACAMATATHAQTYSQSVSAYPVQLDASYNMPISPNLPAFDLAAGQGPFGTLSNVEIEVRGSGNYTVTQSGPVPFAVTQTYTIANTFFFYSPDGTVRVDLGTQSVRSRDGKSLTGTFGFDEFFELRDVTPFLLGDNDLEFQPYSILTDRVGGNLEDNSVIGYTVTETFNVAEPSTLLLMSASLGGMLAVWGRRKAA